MNIRFGDMDVANFHLGARLGHELHHANGPGTTVRVLSEPRFLVALRSQHQGVESIAIAVATEQLDDLLEAFPIRAPRRILELLHLSHRRLEPIRVRALLEPDLGDELTDHLSELGPLLVDGPPDAALFAHEHLVVDLELRQDLRPQLGLPVVDDQDVDQAGVRHLHHVLVLEGIGNKLDLYLGLACGSQASVQRHKTLVVTRRLPHMYSLTGEIIYGRDPWPLGARHDELGDSPAVG